MSHDHDDQPCAKLVDRLLASYQTGPTWMRNVGGYDLPQFDEVTACVQQARALLFPGFVGDAHLGAGAGELHDFICAQLESLEQRLCPQLARALHHRVRLGNGGGGDADERAIRIAEQFVHALPALREQLSRDIDAAWDGDPAATGEDEIILAYPGLYAITCYRMAHKLLELGAPIVPRMIGEHAHQVTGIDIHPGARIGASLFIDHGTGIVIGETAVIGDRVRIYQGVTLGALSLPKGKAHAETARTAKRHPTIEDEVIIYAGATILGGETVIGQGAVIGGNAWVTRSVPAGARVSIDGVTLMKG